MKGWEVQYSEDDQEVCIIPRDSMPFDDLDLITKFFNDKGYTLWVKSDNRKGYNFLKPKKS